MTKSYWEFLATIPSLSSAPQGTIGILGLGAGTIARMIHAHYPGGSWIKLMSSIQTSRCPTANYTHFSDQLMAGWELDPAVVMAARLYMGMDEVEATGKLVCHTGDALVPEATIPGGFAGILVDMFANGSCLPALTQVIWWPEVTFLSPLKEHSGS